MKQLRAKLEPINNQYKQNGINKIMKRCDYACYQKIQKTTQELDNAKKKCFSQNLIEHDKTIYSKANSDDFMKFNK